LENISVYGWRTPHIRFLGLSTHTTSKTLLKTTSAEPFDVSGERESVMDFGDNMQENSRKPMKNEKIQKNPQAALGHCEDAKI